MEYLNDDPPPALEFTHLGIRDEVQTVKTKDNRPYASGNELILQAKLQTRCQVMAIHLNRFIMGSWRN
jgi:hypothetical protein